MELWTGTPAHEEAENTDVGVETNVWIQIEEVALILATAALSSESIHGPGECYVVQPSTAPPLTNLQEIFTKTLPELQAFLLKDVHGTTMSEVTHCLVHKYLPAEYVHCVWVILLPDTNGYWYDVQVLLASIKTGEISTEEDFNELWNTI